MITPETLQSFCADPDWRPNISKPFSKGDYTYATNGIILVRVSRIPEVPENEKAPDVLLPERGYIFVPPNNRQPMPLPKITPPRYCVCLDCHAANEILPSCKDCDGTGKVEIYETMILGKTKLNLCFLRLLATLSNVKLWLAVQSKDAEKPVLFAFDGGDGYIMPMKKD